MNGREIRIYAAGFFDGEGCINLGLVKKTGLVSLTVVLVNTDKSVMDFIYRNFGGSYYTKKFTKNWKTAWTIHWRGRGAIEFLKEIGEFLIVKRPQYDTAMLYWEARIANGRHVGASYGRGQKVSEAAKVADLKFRERMMSLNARGWKGKPPDKGVTNRTDAYTRAGL